jgi:hypothetical protein
MGRVNSLDHFAEIVKAPDNWRQEYNRVMAANRSDLERGFQLFLSLPDHTSESDIQSCFDGLVHRAVVCLQLPYHARNQTPVIVGGFLARNHYDVRTQTDPHFVDSTSDRNMLATEMKTPRRLIENHLWLRQSTGIQTLTALYAYACPTFLFSQKCWKLFLESDGRDQVLTYPFGSVAGRSDYGNSSDKAPMGHDFLRAIVICLLSKRGLEKVEEPSESTAQAGSSVMVTPEKMGQASDRSRSDVMPQKRRKTQHKTPKPPAPLKFSDIVPSFVSGYEDGQPVRTYVRVLSQSETDDIEAAIERDEREARQAATTARQQ